MVLLKQWDLWVFEKEYRMEQSQQLLRLLVTQKGFDLVPKKLLVLQWEGGMVIQLEQQRVVSWWETLMATKYLVDH